MLKNMFKGYKSRCKISRGEGYIIRITQRKVIREGRGERNRHGNGGRNWCHVDREGGELFALFRLHFQMGKNAMKRGWRVGGKRDQDWGK